MLTHLNPQPMRPARAVIVGSHGFLGNAIANRIETEGVPILRVARRDIDLLASDAADHLAGLLQEGDALIAAAAIAPCKNAAMLRDNMTLALALVSAAVRGPVAHVVNISSDAVYADGPVPLSENSPTAPDTLHGGMHLARELMFRTEIKSPLTILRPTLVYGAGDPHNSYGPNRFRRRAAKGEPIELFGEGEERRDHVLIDDLAEIVVRVLMRRSVGTLNIATGAATSFRSLAEMATRIAVKNVPIKTTPRQGPMPHNGYRPFDITACRNAFPDFTYTSLAEGMARAARADLP